VGRGILEILEDNMCPCNSGLQFAACCKDIVLGSKLAQTPLALMRSRYVAHVLQNIEHIIRTMRGVSFSDSDRKNNDLKRCKWTKLEIIDAPEVAIDAKYGIVEFKAYYSLHGKEHIMHERSEFIKVNDQWYYLPKS
jgi:SEC-C motif-containing protein